MAYRPEGIVAFDIGLGLVGEHQGLGSIYGRRRDGFTVDQAMQQVEHMGLGWNACLQGHLYGQEHGILVVLQDQGQDVDHLAVTARLLEQVLLQCSEGLGQLGERGAVAQGARLALNHGRVMPPVIDRFPRLIM